MRRRDRILLPIKAIAIIASFALLVAYVPALAADGDVTAQTGNPALTTSQTAPVSVGSDDYTKTEVVYAKLSATGYKEGIYVVNSFDSKGFDTCTDYGAYTQVTNLTDEQDLSVSGGGVTFDRPQGRFYYQGDLAPTTALPWDVTIAYKLDGREVTAEELGGSSGKLEMQMVIKPNANADKTFSDNYLLQISGTFPGDRAGDIQASDATIAQSGTDTVVTFMLLPGQSATYTVTADVSDFKFDGFQLSGVPLKFALDLDSMGDTSSMTAGITQLQSAISSLNSGASSLSSGATSIGDGLDTIASQNDTLTSGSSQIASGISSASDGAGELATSVNDELIPGVESLASGSQQHYDGLGAQAAAKQQDADTVSAKLASAQAAYKQAVEDYTNAVATCVAGGGDPSSDPAVLAAAGTMNDALTNWMMYQSAAAGLQAAAESLDGAQSGYAGINGGLQSMVDSSSGESIYALGAGTTQLSSGLATLDEQYALFDSGVQSYTGGVSTLASNYSEFESGVSSLASGTSALSSQTATLDKDIIAGMKDELSKYLNSDFTPTSFVDSRNTNIKQVQFVMTTESITYDEPEAENTDEQTTTLWDRFLALFS